MMVIYIFLQLFYYTQIEMRLHVFFLKKRLLHSFIRDKKMQQSKKKLKKRITPDIETISNMHDKRILVNTFVPSYNYTLLSYKNQTGTSVFLHRKRSPKTPVSVVHAAVQLASLVMFLK